MQANYCVFSIKNQRLQAFGVRTKKAPYGNMP